MISYFIKDYLKLQSNSVQVMTILTMLWLLSLWKKAQDVLHSEQIDSQNPLQPS